ncbi:SGS-domain-containing protein [Myriangium duriaei CBS 260.36]|uniref:SGS-domain-containing protein n=1 Tax=Myriangium duriaei CBS 260.36 TaxID=1168546 RepID=A0A9P4MHQ9_9PEZI|nr:SGS-domain-containing protein [Myriangium duriaei CBS 260.36]
MDHAKRGADALTAGRYADAVKEYTHAIEAAPTSPDYHIKRATAHQRSSPSDCKASLADADKAVVLAQKRAKRELIVQAQLRRAIALFGLERYADAKFLFDVVKRMEPKEKSLGIWEAKVQGKLSVLDKDHIGTKVVVTEIPIIAEPKGGTPSDHTVSKLEAVSNNSVQDIPEQTASVQTPAANIRHQFYEDKSNVYVTLLAKGVPEQQTTVDIQEHSLTISFPLVTGSTFDFSKDPLKGAVDITQSTYKILSTKIEVTLRKAQPGQTWRELEGKELPSSNTAPSSTVPLPAAQPTTGPAYPTSSRSGPKDWDKLANDMTKKKEKKEGTANDDEDDWDYEKEGGDEANSFFKKLYAGASPDAQRAMMKSFTESNGTALSTNWEEVKKGTVPTQPPDGVEAKSWKS